MINARIMRLFFYTLVGLTLAAPAGAAPAPRRPAAPGPALKSIEVLPQRVKLIGSRAEQGLVVTGTYADGSQRDLSPAAAVKVEDTKVAAWRLEAGRRVLRPVADGATSAVITIPGAAPARVTVEVQDAASTPPVSFLHEVVPALTKLGCNMGTCHGTPTGKGGLRLSLQGYAPDLDYQAIVREGGARRVNKADPGRSIFLLKPLAEMPHAGGKRLSPEQPEFALLTRWISEGAQHDPEETPQLERVEVLPGRRTLKLPAANQQVVAMAHFSDGTTRDVTRVARLSTSDEDMATVSREGLVEPQKRGDLAVLVRYEHELKSLPITLIKDVPGFTWSEPAKNNYVDGHIFTRLRLFQIPASGLADDYEFIRRAYLDTLGLLPTPEEVRAFRSDASPDKRKQLIARLTERPEFADYWATKWADVLRVQDEVLKKQGARAFHAWIRENLAANKPMDAFARELLTASGPTFSNPPANFFRVVQDPNDLSEATAQLFMGVRMTCAKCHNHPFERWTQDEYYQLSAFFSQVKRREGPTKEEETVSLDWNGQVTHLRTGQVMKPRLPGAGFPEIAAKTDRRVALAEWLTRKDNPFFARAIVNRVWANLLGRGLVEPIDDFRESNPPANGPLLDALAKDFADHNFDFRYLVRTIMESRTYQLTARTLPLNKDDDRYYSHAIAARLTAEQLADAIAEVTGVPDEYEGYPKGTRAAQLAGTAARTPFLKTFGRPDRNLSCECEREKEPTLFQALKLITDRSLQAKLRHDSGRVAHLVKSGVTDEAAVEELYLASLSRPPSPKEKAAIVKYVASASDRRQALEDLAWSLINSKEFQFRH